ncbi:uncharacterized protein LOC124064959 isoform X2 [Scomber scombrus]|uniref:Uncharacterized protein LOC124064959 isoform X2 n=1 Tax=Scomber scombrus TaxID=13677 RepID=A0AAV1NLV7_SCOSC
MSTTETMFPDQSDFDYAHLVPKFQRQKYHLKLYRTYCMLERERRQSSQEPQQQIHAHQWFMAILVLANISQPNG